MRLIKHTHRTCSIGPGAIAGIAAGASFAGGILSNRAAGKEASQARDFTEAQMRNKHQWEVEDLKKAGLNPILSAHGSGSIGPSPAAQQTNPLKDGVNSAVAAYRLSAEVELLQANIDQVESLTSKNNASARGLNNVADISDAAAAAGRGASKLANDINPSFSSGYEALKAAPANIYDMLSTSGKYEYSKFLEALKKRESQKQSHKSPLNITIKKSSKDYN